MTPHRNAHLGKGEPVPGQRMPIVFVPAIVFSQMRFPCISVAKVKHGGARDQGAAALELSLAIDR